jgi:hypothetical protein
MLDGILPKISKILKNNFSKLDVSWFLVIAKAKIIVLLRLFKPIKNPI